MGRKCNKNILTDVTPQLRGCTKGHCEERSDEAILCRWPFDSDNGMRLLRRPERLGRLAMTPSSSVSEALLSLPYSCCFCNCYQVHCGGGMKSGQATFPFPIAVSLQPRQARAVPESVRKSSSTPLLLQFP